MRRFSAFFIAVIMVLCVTAPILAFTFDASASAAGDTPKAPEQAGDNVNITVMLPAQEPEPTTVPVIADPLPAPTPKPNPNPKPAYPELYPSDVYEFYDETSRQIIKTYELTDKENPAGISRESFERDGWLYNLTDVTKKENAYASTREQTETATLETATKDTDAIIKLLAPTMEYQSDDGFIGVLTLDISSIKVETAGTKKSSYTMTATREYPHLSSNDTSLVPKTITQNGVTYTLSSVDWNTQNAEAVDYNQIPTSYTANAKYSATGSKTTVTGYVTTANYVGTVGKILTGRTVYTAYFTGQPIAPTTSESSVEPEQSDPPFVATEPEQSEPEGETETDETDVEAKTEPVIDPTEQLQNDRETSQFNLMWLAVIPLMAIASGGTYYFMKRKENDNAKTDNPVSVSTNGGDDDTTDISAGTSCAS